ncbi:MAG: hypothetical protein WCE52_16440 [Candidatus Acidiferrum sp.]
MLILVLCIVAALALVLALVAFSRSRSTPDWPAASQDRSTIRQLPQSSFASAAAIQEAIFSGEDWEFIKRERCPALEELFLSERKAVACYWLTVTSSRISAIRHNHLQNSRLAHDLSPGQELRLLGRFLYLSVVCRVGLLVIQLGGPLAPADLMAHIQRIADGLPVARENSFAPLREN